MIYYIVKKNFSFLIIYCQYIFQQGTSIFTNIWFNILTLKCHKLRPHSNLAFRAKLHFVYDHNGIIVLLKFEAQCSLSQLQVSLHFWCLSNFTWYSLKSDLFCLPIQQHLVITRLFSNEKKSTFYLSKSKRKTLKRLEKPFQVLIFNLKSEKRKKKQ